MKKINKRIFAALLTLIMVIASFPITSFADTYDWGRKIDNVFYDSYLKKYVSNYVDLDQDGYLSEEECAKVTSLELASKGITNLNGLELFTELETLNINDNNVTNISLSGLTKLKKLYADNNKLSGINVGSQLEVLHMAYNKGLQYPNFGAWPNLIELDCSYSDVATWAMSSICQHTNMEKLYCEGLGLSILDVSKMTNLTELKCGKNSIASIDLSNNKKLEVFDCSDNVVKISISSPSDKFYNFNGNEGNKIDVTKASNWRGATFDYVLNSDGSYASYWLTDFTMYQYKHQVKYDYDLGNGMTATFTLVYEIDGEEDDVILEGYTISLKDKICLNFDMILSDRIASSDAAYLEFKYADKELAQVYVKDTEIYVDENGKKHYLFPCDVPAKEMVCDITAQLFNGDEVSDVYKYTVKDYSEYILENQHLDSYKNSADMVKSMLGYGAYAQIYFMHNTEELAYETKHISDDEREMISEVTAQTLEQYANEDMQYNDAFYFAGSTLTLESRTSMRLYFAVSSKADVSNLEFEYNGKTLDYVKSGNYYCVDIDNISPQNLDKEFVVTVSDGNYKLDVTYSVMSYCYASLVRNSNINLQNAMKALYLYNKAAKEYFE